MSRRSRSFSDTPARAWSLALAVAASLVCAACASTGLPEDEAARPRRKPDGVAIDPVSAPPYARESANVADGVVTLRTPLGVKRALAVVEDLFRKVVVEDGEGVAALFTRDALTLQPGMTVNQGSSAALFWQGRFKKLDYTKLAGEPIFHEGEISIFRPTDGLETLPHPSVRPETLADGDVVLRVPIVTSRVGADRFFGDDIVFWMRREGDHFLIYRVLEDFQIN